MQPPIYLINLDKSPDRLQTCSQRLAEHSLSFIRVPGVLGAALSQQEIAAHYSSELNQQNYHRPLSSGEIGCYLSHRKAWEKIAHGKAPYAIVLEDDIKIVGSLADTVQALDNISFEWDVIKLAAYRNRTRRVVFRHSLVEGIELVLHNKPMSGGAATAISKFAAKKLLTATEQFGRPVDVDIQCCWETGTNVLSLLPYPFAQDLSYESTIKTTPAKMKSHFFQRKKNQLMDGLKNKKFTSDYLTSLRAAISKSGG
ncbi:glycosyltransferase family 25 protein [Alteromonas sediminis]|uniref:Glycosyltransferase family 25 protein n=1 Tax=Alteromonas sediminis TaxID=2259342 RepID=A0A3N5XYY3_9ALTE|nr:glycosyltransferase family 25 protein [Alteromonas sediminis]RPJ65683.1 glycosyltransferase family 25 protein [Alteromonas sediminis]